jgi:cyclic pyranopterin phosphate synthase
MNENNKRIDVKISFQCNNLCRFCIQGDKRKRFPDKNFQEVMSILKRERANCNSVIFTGGEPTIQARLIDYIKYAKALDYEIIHIQTNGRRFFYKDYCLELIEAGANVFNPAIHGSNAKMHDYLTRSPGSFKQTMQGIKNLHSLKQRLFFNTVINKINYQDIPKITKMLVGFKPDVLQLAFMHIAPLIQKNSTLIEKIVPRYSQVEKYVKKGLQIGINAKVNINTEAIPYCFMKGYEKYVVEDRIPNSNIYDASGVIRNFNKARKTNGKAKGSNCHKCKYDKVCEGPWKDYSDIFGWDEFKPVK